MAGKNRAGSYLRLLVMCFCAVAFYQVIYLRWTFYDGLLALSGLSNAQFGVTMSMYGIVGMICYLPGGIIADKVEPRKLICLSLLIVGGCGMWLTFRPGYAVQLIIYSLMAVASNMLFWAALMKATRQLEARDGKGKMFGFLEGGRGLLQTLASLVFVYIFGLAANQIAGIQLVLRGYAVLNFLFAAVAFFTLDREGPVADKKDGGIKASEVIDVLKMPAIWLIAVVIISCYSIHLGSTYLTPYFTNVIGATASIAAVLAVFRNYILQFVGGPAGGFLAERKKSTSKVVVGAYAVMAAGAAVLVLLPSSPNMIVPVAVTLILVCGSIYVMRGIYYALIGEAGIPLKLTGTAIGAVSLIGFTPDIFMNPVCGALIDRYEGAAGYRIIFVIILAFAVLGLIAAGILLRMSTRETRRQELNRRAAQCGEQT